MSAYCATVLQIHWQLGLLPSDLLIIMGMCPQHQVIWTNSNHGDAEEDLYWSHLIQNERLLTLFVASITRMSLGKVRLF